MLQKKINIVSQYKSYRLGEVQNQFNTYLKSCSDYNRFVELKYHEKKKLLWFKREATTECITIVSISRGIS